MLSTDRQTDKLTNVTKKHNLLCQGGKNKPFPNAAKLQKILWEEKKQTKPTGVCLVVAVGLTQDLTLILSTINTEENKTKKIKLKQESIYYKTSG